jgi:hypothetical protein
MQADLHRTPVQIIKGHLHDWLDHSPMTETVFAANVREVYEVRYPEHARSIEWSQAGDPVVRLESDRGHVMRWFSKGSNARLPAEIYDVVVEVFPPERRFALEQDLAAERRGVFVYMPGVRGQGVMAMGRMAKETAEAIAAVGSLYEDGLLDERDAPKAPWALLQIDEAVASLLEMRADIERKVMGREPASQPLHVAE